MRANWSDSYMRVSCPRQMDDEIPGVVPNLNPLKAAARRSGLTNPFDMT